MTTPEFMKELEEARMAWLWEKGRFAWNDVPSATDWVEELRGNDIHKILAEPEELP